MEHKLEITKKLEDLGDQLDSDDFVAILNLPDANLCSKRGEFVLRESSLEQACKGCVTQSIKMDSRLSQEEVKEVIDYFAKNYGTKFITINGRGEVFHSHLREMSLWKIKYADSKGIQSYIFTPGNDLDEQTCITLAERNVNVMISLYGNRFIDADFFEGRAYPEAQRPIQNQADIARQLRDLIRAFRESPNQPEQGTTRLGMNYVVDERDLVDGATKVKRMKEAVNRNGIFFVCNTDFYPHPNPETQRQLRMLSKEYTDFHISHSTGVGGQCQMGAGSAVTIDFNGDLYRCPYMSGGGNGKFQSMSDFKRREVIGKYLKDRAYSCGFRRTPIAI